MAEGKLIDGPAVPQQRWAGLSPFWSVSSLLVLLLLCLPVVALACSGGNPVGGAVVASTRPETVVIKKQVTGSVLITPAGGDSTAAFSRIEILPRRVVLDRREQTDMSAQALGPDQRPLPDVEFMWIVTDPRAGSITSEGLFRAGRKPGVYADAVMVTGVQRNADGVRYASESVTVTVIGDEEPPELTEVAILPANPTVLSGQIFRLWAVGFDEDGLVIRGVRLVWHVNDPDIGRVNDIGYLTTKGGTGTFDGALTVTGTWNGREVSATANVTIIEAPEADNFLDVQVLPQRFYLEPGQRLPLTAIALNGRGELVPGAELRWTTVDSDAGTVGGQGLFVAGDIPGVYTEAVRVEAIAWNVSGFLRAVDYASVVVRANQTSRLDRVGLFAESVIVAPGGRAILVADPIDEFGQPARNVVISWDALDETVGIIDEQGYFKATGSTGIYHDALGVTVRQTAGEQEVTRSETVDVIITGSLNTVYIRPSLMAIGAGRTAHFSTFGTDENGITLPGLVTRWRMLDESVGTVDPLGNFTAGPTPGFYEDAISGEVTQTIRGRR